MCQLQSEIRYYKLAGPTNSTSCVPTVPVVTAAAVTASTAAAAVAVPTPTETLPSKRKTQFHILSEFCKRVQGVKVESLRHSTSLEFSSQRDNKKNG